MQQGYNYQGQEVVITAKARAKLATRALDYVATGKATYQ